jgi:hypothetical protein
MYPTTTKKTTPISWSGRPTETTFFQRSLSIVSALTRRIVSWIVASWIVSTAGLVCFFISNPTTTTSTTGGYLHFACSGHHRTSHNKPHQPCSPCYNNSTTTSPRQCPCYGTGCCGTCFTGTCSDCTTNTTCTRACACSSCACRATYTSSGTSFCTSCDSYSYSSSGSGKSLFHTHHFYASWCHRTYCAGYPPICPSCWSTSPVYTLTPPYWHSSHFYCPTR